MTKSKEIERLKERVLVLEVALAKQMPKTASAEMEKASGALWRERWFGSGGKEGYEGWSIVGGRELIAYLGREISSEAVSAIVMAHNATLAEPTTKAESAHPDDIAVDALATAMKFKLAKQRSKGYGGWDTDCTQQRLSDLLRGHVDKGDPTDVANFCAFLSARGEGIAVAPADVLDAKTIAGALFDFLGYLTTLPAQEAVTFSECHEASSAVEHLEKWAEKRSLSLDEADVLGWHTTKAEIGRAHV